MAGRLLNTMPMADRLAEDGRSLAEQRVFGESPHWLPCMMDYSGSMMSSRTPSLNGRVIHENRRSPFANCLAKLTGSKRLRGFSAHRFETETRWQFGCRRLLNPAALLSMARVISRFLPNCCAGNQKVAAQSRTSKDTCRTGLGFTVSTTKRILSAIRCWQRDLN